MMILDHLSMDLTTEFFNVFESDKFFLFSEEYKEDKQNL